MIDATIAFIVALFAALLLSVKSLDVYIGNVMSDKRMLVCAWAWRWSRASIESPASIQHANKVGAIAVGHCGLALLACSLSICCSVRKFWLRLNRQGFDNVTPGSAFNTTVSFRLMDAVGGGDWLVKRYT